jgi:hypothetical protein
MNPNSQHPSILARRCYTHVVDALLHQRLNSLHVPRFFTLLEAESLLPQVEGLLNTLVQLKRDHDRAESELDRINQRIAVSGGMIVRREQVQQLRARKDACAQGLKTAVEKIQEIGCELKDIETGLVDFPTVYRGKEVYLCWKLGESGIAFWHHIEDGYRGRQPIDSEFLTNHSAG